jgi:hypothetical protein
MKGSALGQRGKHKVVDVLALALEAGRAIGHDTLALSGTDGATQVAVEEPKQISFLAVAVFDRARPGAHVLPDLQNLHSLHSAV